MNRYYDFAPSGLAQGWDAFKRAFRFLDNKPAKVALLVIAVVVA